ncbi:MAG: heat-inducible transcriptional repressor HrcA [Deltaproteobacteria bacterium]
MILDDRKLKILQAIVEDYVLTGDPVGSRTVAKKYILGMSPATIRNDMADLEELGFLQQPHTSAGRVPSDQGYREYVDRLMHTKNLSKDDSHAIEERLTTVLKDIGHLMKLTSKIISQVTNYTTVAITPQLNKTSIKHLQFVPIDKTKILLVLVTSIGTVKNFLIKVSKEYDNDFLYLVSNILNEKFKDFPLQHIDSKVLDEIEKSSKIEKEVLSKIFETLKESANSADSADVFLDGTSNIFNFPEFNDVSKAKDFLQVLGEPDFLIKLIGDESDSRIKIRIGSENQYKEIKNCSLITTSFWSGNELLATLGVIGPTRMDYAKVIACIEYLRNEMPNLLTKFEDK